MSQTLTVQMALEGASVEATADFSVAPRAGFNYDIDGGILSAASTLGCAPLTAAKVFSSTMPASYPGHVIPATVTHPLAVIKIKLTVAAPWISAADQTALTRVFASMPSYGTPMVSINQEGEAGRFGYSGAQVAGSHATAYSLFQAHAPSNAIYCQDFQTYSATPQGRGSKFSSYICPGLPLYLLDWYPSSATTDAVDSVMPAYGYIRAVSPDAPIGIAECNYTTDLTGGVTWTGGTQAQWFSHAWAWAIENNCPLFMGYFLTAHGVPWPPVAATITELSAIAHASGL